MYYTTNLLQARYCSQTVPYKVTEGAAVWNRLRQSSSSWKLIRPDDRNTHAVHWGVPLLRICPASNLLLSVIENLSKVSSLLEKARTWVTLLLLSTI